MPEDTAPDGGRTPRTLKLTLSYDGTGFVGWQRQAKGVSIQGLLEEALSVIEERPVSITGAGRTDAGVHALGQTASVRITHPLEPARLRRALNAMLPPEVRVLAVDEAPAAFDARRDARTKTYRYSIVNAEIVSPFERRYVWHVPQPLDLEVMTAAARSVEGRHDFSAFLAAGSEVATTVRTVFASTLREAGDGERLRPPGALAGSQDPSPGRLLVYEVTGEGFLRHMVRTIVGTLVEIGSGRRDAHAVEAALDARERRAAGPTAPATGLCLVSVSYGP